MNSSHILGLFFDHLNRPSPCTCWHIQRVCLLRWDGNGPSSCRHKEGQFTLYGKNFCSTFKIAETKFGSFVLFPFWFIVPWVPYFVISGEFFFFLVELRGISLGIPRSFLSSSMHFFATQEKKKPKK